MTVSKTNMTANTASDTATTDSLNPIEKFKEHIAAFKLLGESTGTVTRRQYFEVANAVMELIPKDNKPAVTDLSDKRIPDLLEEAISGYTHEKISLKSLFESKNNYGRTNTVSDLFDYAPSQWGLRGDRLLWEEMRKNFSYEKMPSKVDELESLIMAEYQKCTGRPLIRCSNSDLI